MADPTNNSRGNQVKLSLYERHTKMWSGQLGPPVLYRFIQFLAYQAYSC